MCSCSSGSVPPACQPRLKGKSRQEFKSIREYEHIHNPGLEGTWKTSFVLFVIVLDPLLVPGLWVHIVKIIGCELFEVF